MTPFTFKKHPLEFGEFRMRLHRNGKPVGKSITFYVDQSFEAIACRLLINYAASKTRAPEHRKQAVALYDQIRAQGAAAIPWHGQPQAPATHHPDCQCNECYYGADLAKWRFNPSEY